MTAVARARTGSRCTATARASGTPPIALGVAPRELAAGTDTMMFCLSKGLGAPVGSVLCGTTRRRSTEARADRVAPRWSDAPGGRDRRGRASSRSRRWSTASPTTTRAPAASPTRSPTGSRGASTPTTVETNIVCARADALPTDAGRRARGRTACSAGTIDVDTVRFVTHKDVDDAGVDRGRRRARRDRRSRPDQLPLVGHGARPTTSPRARWPSTPTPTIPRSRPGARSPSGPRRAATVWVLITARGDKGTPDPDADLDALAALRVRGDRQGGRAARLRRPLPPRLPRRRARPTTRSCAARSCGSSASCGPRSCCAPTPRRCSSATATSTTTTTGSPGGRRSTRSRRPPATRTTSRSTSREGLAVHQVARGVPVGHARAEHAGSTSATRSSARSTRCSATPASSPTRASGSASSCASAPRRPAPPRGMQLRRGLPRLTFGA